MKSAQARPLLLVAILLTGILFWASNLQAQPNVRYAKQGFSMRLCFDNRCVFGRAAYPGVIGGIDPGPDSIGLEYPIGQPYEHVFGAGLWVGGLLDTAQIGASNPLRLVTVGYEGWIGPYFEFYPGSSPADTIWKATGRGVPRPSSWNGYWGDLIPSVSFSDNDLYCLYDDSHVNVGGHVPLKLKVAQSSFVWSDAYAEAVHIMEYRIVNMGTKRIDSAFVGLFLDAEVGPYQVANYSQHNLAGYFPDIRTAYVDNPVDIGSTPVGVALLHAPRPLDSLVSSFRWWPGPSSPNTDSDRFQKLSSGLVDSNQSISNLLDTRFLVSVGPFTIRPTSGPDPDTAVVAFGIVSGQNLSAMRLHAERAKIIYENGGETSVYPGSNEVPGSLVLFQNYPNPFNPSTTIRFSLPRAAFVKLTVFNTLGQEVASLVNQEMKTGEHSIVWNASEISSGVYIVRLQAGEQVNTGKMLLLR